MSTSSSAKGVHGRPGSEVWHDKQKVDGSGEKTFKWPAYNERIHLPVEGVEKPAYICHMRYGIKYSSLKFWYVCSFIRGRTIEDAITQCQFCKLKGAQIAKDVLREAQELAVREHNVEFKTNLWVAEAFAGRAEVIKGIRRHARGRMGVVEYKYTNLFIRLEEGKPPKNYYEWHAKKTPYEMLEDYITKHREKNIPFH